MGPSKWIWSVDDINLFPFQTKFFFLSQMFRWVVSIVFFVLIFLQLFGFLAKVLAAK